MLSYKETNGDGSMTTTAYEIEESDYDTICDQIAGIADIDGAIPETADIELYDVINDKFITMTVKTLDYSGKL